MCEKIIFNTSSSTEDQVVGSKQNKYILCEAKTSHGAVRRTGDKSSMKKHLLHKHKAENNEFFGIILLLIEYKSLSDKTHF